MAKSIFLLNELIVDLLHLRPIRLLQIWLSKHPFLTYAHAAIFVGNGTLINILHITAFLTKNRMALKLKKCHPKACYTPILIEAAWPSSAAGMVPALYICSARLTPADLQSAASIG